MWSSSPAGSPAANGASVFMEGKLHPDVTAELLRTASRQEVTQVQLGLHDLRFLPLHET